MPRVGCDHVYGSTWDRIEPLITSTLSDQGIAVAVYAPN